MPLATYFRERIFEPLGMEDTDLLRSERIASRLATGYALGRRGAKAVPDRDWIGAGAGGVYSTTRDMARFAAALMGGGANEHGSILEAATLGDDVRASPPAGSSRLPGMGSRLRPRRDAGGHLVVGHDGILPGFNSTLLVAPDDGIGGGRLHQRLEGRVQWMETEFKRLLRLLLDVPDEVVRTDIAHRPEVLGGDLRSLPAAAADLRPARASGAPRQASRCSPAAGG